VSVSSRDGGIEVAVTDDGSGFDRQQSGTSAPGHIGLATMAERAELAGGWCTVKSSSGGGTSVRAWVPLPSAELR
jgi:signal transduction histidine kinase